MAGREVEIHRGRLDKEILADRAQLFHPKIYKTIFKNFEKIEKAFSFFWMDILKILEKSQHFFDFEAKIESHFEGSKSKIFEIFRKFSKSQSKK